MNIYAIIMAGGVGSRFWPRSREKKPKQLLNLFDEESLIRKTVSRLSGLVSPENILVITNQAQVTAIQEELPEIPVANIIAEPYGRNTAACVALSAAIVAKRDPDAVCFVLPADHLIPNVELFQTDLLKGANYAYELEGLVTLGIPPTRPETGYGYIQFEAGKPGDDVFKVATFAEKPNYATAVRFLQSGDFMWNSGMFIWKASVILDEISIFLPELAEQIGTLIPVIDTDKFDETLEKAYSQIKGISIDYGIMEKSHRVFLIKASFNWSDVGSWEEVYQLSKKDERGNASTGNVFTNMTHNTYIYSPHKFTSAIGVDNLIIINTEDSLLVCRRDQAQEVKQIVDFLKHNNMSDLL